MDYKDDLYNIVKDFLARKYDLSDPTIEFIETKKDFEGDITIVLFNIIKLINDEDKESLGESIGNELVAKSNIVDEFNLVQGFLNLEIADTFYIDSLHFALTNESFFEIQSKDDIDTFMVEYSSPNTNKPLHLGHIRNNLLGYSISKILEANGKKVIKTQIINDRGIHICKSIVAWKLYGENSTPESTGIKGDEFVGNYYVLFEKKHKEEVEELISNGINKEEAVNQSNTMKLAKETLKNWENGDKEVRDIWKMMNDWVYVGFEETYNTLGVSFDKNYYESETYLLGKEIVNYGLENNVFYKKEDSSIWVDLTDDGLDEKLLLRSDGTSVYMTQDLGTAKQRIDDFPEIGGMVYTVGNEQDYHFQVLFKILKRLGYKWANNLFHLSYGMVDLPTGKMKSREGKVIDADDLVLQLIESVKETSQNLGKFQNDNNAITEDTYRKIALGALKYFILKVDPKKRILFNPEESIDLSGNTGPFIQYTYVRIHSILNKLEKVENSKIIKYKLNEKEKDTIKCINRYNDIIKNAKDELSPAIICNYLYDLVKTFNSLYQNHNILSAETPDSIVIRTQISFLTGKVISKTTDLLGIELPDKM
jgi:arginyl-tRNA synthetase|tara:strand:- start:513 stop:2294 length:1782 start_codon:yes stop_codon:yes gene_type:complete